MKRILLALVCFAALEVAAHAEWVNGYITWDGRYVPGYFRSPADGVFQNNYSTRGNVNPYTGQAGYRTYQPYRYQSYRPYRWSYSWDD